MEPIKNLFKIDDEFWTKDKNLMKRRFVVKNFGENFWDIFFAKARL